MSGKLSRIICLKCQDDGLLQRIAWHPSGAHRELCFLKGKSEVSSLSQTITDPSQLCTIFLVMSF